MKFLRLILMLATGLPSALPAATLWLEPENMPALEHWKISRDHGDDFLCGAEDGPKPGAEAASDTATITLAEAGIYRLWVRSKDFAAIEPATRSFRVALNDSVSTVAFGTHRADGFQWQDGGEFSLPAGPCRVTLIDSSAHYAKVDKLMLTTDLALRPSGRGEKENVAYLRDHIQIAPDDGVRLEADFPGGNILFDRRVGNTFYIRQDLRDTGTDWFYWCFRVRGAAGKTLSFRFTGTPPIGSRGPAVSADGLAWRWLGKTDHDRFTYSFSGDENEVHFGLGMTYTRRNLDAFLARHRDNPALRATVLTRTRNDAPVPLLSLGSERADRGVIFITARHHSCEMMASYVVEGFIEQFLSDTPDGAWLRDNIACRIVPLVDLDGVEAGDQGKNREPRDHNRDYADDIPGRYPEVAAIRELIAATPTERLRALIDIHCPYKSGKDHEYIYQTGRGAAPLRFGEILEHTALPSLPYHVAKERAPATGNDRSTGASFGAWASRRAPASCLVTTFEVPYSNAEGVVVDQASARAFGRRMALALHDYLNTDPALAALPLPAFHLTARPWRPSGVSRDAILDVVENGCRALARLQDASGAIIDPDLHREHQYGTPYFAFAVGALLEGGRAPELRENGIRAMDHATGKFALGANKIPDRHAEFFDAALPAALPMYERRVAPDVFARWRERLSTPREKIVRGPDNNWRAYAMRGEWLRARLGLIDEAAALRFIRDEWFDGGQRDRLRADPLNLYQDRGTDPDSLSVDSVGRLNLLDLVESGYAGEAADEIRAAARRGTTATLLLQDPSGQCPPNGRADNHVWNDVLYQLGFTLMAEHETDPWRAGQFRRASRLSFQSIRRWLRTDDVGAGLFQVTKNHFAPSERVGYQAASHTANYNGAVLLHLAQAWLAETHAPAEQPCPAEIGGYAFVTGDAFATAVANAGGMQLVAALRGDREPVYDRYWTALGVERLGRAGWDTRLGPSDGIRDSVTRRGVTFAPTWMKNGRWVRLADLPDRYRGEFSARFVHPLLVRCAIDYRPIHGPGPRFRHEFILTPDGILSTLHGDADNYGVTCPLLENDGRPLQVRLTERAAATSYDPAGDQQCFIVLGEKPRLVADEGPLLSSYGWLRPVRATTSGRPVSVFVYPRGPQDPAADDVARSFRSGETGFSTSLGRVDGTLYVGRGSAGGEGDRIDCDGDGRPDAEFSASCRFILQLDRGRITAVEADRDVRVRLQDRQIELRAHTPVSVVNSAARIDARTTPSS